MNKGHKHIPSEKIDQIRDSINIVDLIQEHLELKASGQQFKGLCPFHPEKTPSFYVYPSGQHYHCFGCQSHGSAIHFLMNIGNYDFLDALAILAKRSGILLDLDKSEYQNNSDDLFSCLEESNRFFKKNLQQANKKDLIHQYLQKRKISPSSVEKFQIGYVPDGWKNLHDHLSKKGFSHEIQDKCGLIKTSEKIKGFYDRLRGRIIFPIRDQYGKIIGFSGRIVGEGEPKYLNPPETDLYKKGTIFYGYYEAKEEIRKKKRVAIVEGYLDVIRLHENGYGESIATCGTSLTVGHLNILSRLRPKIYLLFDGDQAGLKATEKAAKLFLQNNLECFVLALPDNLDPDDYFKRYSSNDFEALLEQAPSDHEFLLDQTKNQIQGKGIETQKEKILELVKVADEIKDSIKKNLFLNLIGRNFGINQGDLRKKLTSEKTNKPIAQTKESSSTPSSRPLNDEEKLLYYLMIKTEAISLAREYLQPKDLNNKDLAKMYGRFLNLEDSEFILLKTLEFVDYFPELSDPIMSIINSASHHKTQTNPEEYLSALAFNIKKQKIESIQKEMYLDPYSPETRNLIEQKKKLKKEISHLSRREVLTRK